MTTTKQSITNIYLIKVIRGKTDACHIISESPILRIYFLLLSHQWMLKCCLSMNLWFAEGISIIVILSAHCHKYFWPTVYNPPALSYPIRLYTDTWLLFAVTALVLSKKQDQCAKSLMWTSSRFQSSIFRRLWKA